MSSIQGGCELSSHESKHLREFLKCVKDTMMGVRVVEIDNGQRYAYGLYVEGEAEQLVRLLSSLPGSVVREMSGATWVILNGGSEVVIVRGVRA